MKIYQDLPQKVLLGPSIIVAQSVRQTPSSYGIHCPFLIYKTTVGLSILALRMSTSESSQMKDFFLKHAVSCHEIPSPYLNRKRWVKIL